MLASETGLLTGAWWYPVGGDNREDMTHELDPGKRKSLIPSPVLGRYVPLAFPALQAAQGLSLEIVKWC